MENPPELPPHSIPAEEGLLGALLIDGGAIIEVNPNLRPRDFFILRNSYVFGAMRRLHERGETIDNLSVAEELKQSKQLEEVGSEPYLIYLINEAPGSQHARTHAEFVFRCAIRRDLIAALGEVAGLAWHETLEEALVGITRLLHPVISRYQVKRQYTFRQAVQSFWEQLDVVMSGDRDYQLAMPTFISEVDAICTGFRKGSLSVIAGRPGMGKSQLLFNCFLNAASRNIPSALYSLEMNKDQVISRLVARRVRINSKRLDSGELDEREYGRFVDDAAQIGKLPGVIDDAPTWNIEALCRDMERLHEQQGIEVFFIDYLQLLGSELAFKPGDRVGLVSHISKLFVASAREMNVPVVAASQLNRQVEYRKDKIPTIGDLRESGTIEQDSSLIVLLYREDYYRGDDESPDGLIRLDVAKNRFGGTGTIHMRFVPEFAEIASPLPRYGGYQDIDPGDHWALD